MSLIRRHRHLSPSVLSEYLDERLSGSEKDRVAARLASCQVCHAELEGLLLTVGLLRGLPVAILRRSFVMSAPPTPLSSPITNSGLPVGRRLPLLLRMPQWAYAAMASVAVLILAVVVSADITGRLALAPQMVVQQTSSSQEGSVLPSDASTSPQALTVEKPALGPLEGLRAMGVPPSADAPAPQPVAAPRSAVPTAPSAGATPLPVEPSSNFQPKAEMPVTGVGGQPSALRQLGGTAAVWRIGEGIVAALGLAFLIALVLKRRLSSRASRF
jgi:hypothetical protein